MADSAPGGQPRLSASDILLRKQYGLPMSASDAEVREKMDQAQVAHLLDNVVDHVGQYIDLDPQYLDAVVLWATATHIYRQFRYFPYLLVTAPTHGSGKSTLLDVLSGVVLSGYRTGGVTRAALLKYSKTATLLLDEIDSDPLGFRTLIQVLNQGFERDVPFTQQKNNYDVYGPKALAGNEPIGLRPATESRTLPIYMLRSRPGSTKAQYTVKSDWHIRVAATTTDAVMPQIAHLDGMALGTLAKLGIENRTRDLWLPLFVWAHAAGKPWIDRATKAMHKVEGTRRRTIQPGLVVLDALRDIFATRGEKVPSMELVDALSNHDEVIDARLRIDPVRLSALLRPFMIERQTFWLGGKAVKGYVKSDFADAWARWPR